MHNFCFYFFIFYFFRASSSSIHVGWAGLNAASPAQSLAQTSDLAEQSNTRALIHACCYTVQVN